MEDFIKSKEVLFFFFYILFMQYTGGTTLELFNSSFVCCIFSFLTFISSFAIYILFWNLSSTLCAYLDIL